MNTFSLEIITPGERQAWPGVASVDVPADGGRLTVLARHEPFICSLLPGRVLLRLEAGGARTWTISAGVMTVSAEGVTLLVRQAREEERPSG
jgi:F0F1-type ATP synthase epsilon subunit